MVKEVGDMMIRRPDGFTKKHLRDGFAVMDNSHQEYYWSEYRESDENGNTRRGECEHYPMPETESYPGFLRRAKGDER